MAKQVHVQIGDNGLPIRIFRDKSWRDLPEDQVRKMDKNKAVAAIRVQVFDKACSDDDDFVVPRYCECERCGRGITWQTMEMHETIPKGEGGEVAISNCEALCHACHTGDLDSAHGNRRFQSAKIKS